MLEDELQQYLTELGETAAEPTVRSHKATLRMFVDEADRRNISADEITVQVVVDHLARLVSERGYAWATIDGKISTLSNFLAYLWGTDPSSIRYSIQVGLEKRGDDSKPNDVDTNERQSANRSLAIKQFLDYVRNSAYGTRAHAITELMMATGARLNSVLDLDLTDLDLSQSQPTVRISVSDETAVGQNGLVLTRVVDLPDECVSAIETYVEYERVSLENAEPPEPLFTSRQGRVTAATVRRSMAAMMDAARTGCGDPSDGETDDDVTSDEGTGDEGDAVRQISPIDIRWYALRQRLNGNN